ncbi:SRPBCC family protein [Lewinella sp. W8]|uniref:SRPBCC family protein n=1 Tax=Lewinella sp. W8 TaxID=2528208 RepID=UPI0015668AC4|nr:SRPBCC family protein [Lewinella sp. W8]
MSTLTLLLAFFTAPALAQKEKKVQTFTVSHLIAAPADQVWAVVGEDYGAIAKSHPKIVSSNYVDGTLQAGEGAQRVCNFNEQGTKYLKEVQREYDPENMTFRNQVYQAGKFPVDPERTFAIYRVEAVDANTSRFTFKMTYRTKPAFMGALAKGSFKKLIADYAIAIEHYVNTGEAVTKENFRQIKKVYARKK